MLGKLEVNDKRLQNAIRDKLIEEGCTVNQGGIERIAKLMANYQYRELNRLCDEIERIKDDVRSDTGFEDETEHKQKEKND